MSQPIALDAESIEHLKTLATPIPVQLRGGFLTQVFQMLRDRPVSPPAVYRAARAVQQLMLRSDAPEVIDGRS